MCYNTYVILCAILHATLKVIVLHVIDVKCHVAQVDSRG